MAATLIITVFLLCKSELRVLLCGFCSTVLFYGFIFYVPLLWSVTVSPVTGRPGSVSVTDLSGARLVIHLTARAYERDPHLLPQGLRDWLSHEPATECDRPWLPLCFPHGSKCEVASTSSSHI